MSTSKEGNGFALEQHPLNAEQSSSEESYDVVSEDSHTPEKALIYKVGDNPPIHLTIIFGFQQALLSFANQLALSLMVSEVVCGDHDALLRTRLLSSTLFMNGFTTVMMVMFGVRLPLFQGGSYEYVAPLAALLEIDPNKCKAGIITTVTNVMNHTLSENLTLAENSTLMNVTTETMSEDFIFNNIQSLMGSLMLAGFIHFLIGATGLIGILLRFIGPVTIVPAILLIGLYMFKTITRFVAVHWGIGMMTCAISLILSLYMGRWHTPIPFWTKKRGFHIVRSKFHQTAAILIALIIGWIVSAILTSAGVFSSDPNAPDFNARTDVHIGVIQNASWFYVPHPGQFGPPSFSATALVGFLIATLISILDSIGDYYACARTCMVPPPPSHAVNRGIAMEGLCSFFSGTVGCGHATSTYGGNIGAIGLTKVASRRVFLVVGLLYMLFGILGKFSAIFITIPHPVLGGTLITMIGMFTGVVLSNLQFVKLSSTRNLAIIGISVIIGLMVPYWVERHMDRIQTGIANLDQLLRMLLGNPNLAGAVVAFFLDNTIPGTREERGLTAWDMVRTKKGEEENDYRKETKEENKDEAYLEGMEVYQPLLPKRILNSKIMKYIPFMPNPETSSYDNKLDDRCNGNV